MCERGHADKKAATIVRCHNAFLAVHAILPPLITASSCVVLRLAFVHFSHCLSLHLLWNLEEGEVERGGDFHWTTLSPVIKVCQARENSVSPAISTFISTYITALLLVLVASLQRL